LPGIDEYSAALIINEREKKGKITSLSQLYSVHKIDKKVINAILPFVTLWGPINKRRS